MTPLALNRAPDWEERLALYLDNCAERVFVWGQHDCALFAAGAVRAMTGVDPAADFRDLYSDRAGAALALREVGAGTLNRTAQAWFGKSLPAAQAHRGDLVMRGHTTLGVCVGRWSWFVGEEYSREGLIALPTADCSRAFRVPYDLGDSA